MLEVLIILPIFVLKYNVKIKLPMETKFYDGYLAPVAEVVDVVVERGFAASSNVEDPIEDSEQDWN